ncbi:MAG: DNA-binding protein [Burkholderiales bacterium]|nr:DNA-binding protein [Burkholderiales bacterium]
MDIHAIRLKPGEDLRLALERLTMERAWKAAFIVSAVGSLDRACLRFAGRDEEALIEGELELVALSGTLCANGVHLHAAVADRTGVVTGGHLLPGCRVRTTAELVIGSAPELSFRRELDAQTGHHELAVTAGSRKGVF